MCNSMQMQSFLCLFRVKMKTNLSQGEKREKRAKQRRKRERQDMDAKEKEIKKIINTKTNKRTRSNLHFKLSLLSPRINKIESRKN